MIATYVIIAVILIVLATWEKSPFRMYWKSEAGMAFVRTGFGGAKAVLGRGALVIPLLHKVQWVDLGETKLLVSKREDESILTKDHLRVDMDVEFYVRVRADKESVLQASVALGRRAQHAEGLRNFLEPALVDAVQTVASDMTLPELHDDRIRFTRMVQEFLLKDLNTKGLELTNVSLTSFDQTPMEHYDPDNVFDAEGLLAIRELTETRKKQRNEIEKEQALLIEQKNLEVRKRSLELERERSFAEQDTRKAIEAQKEERDRELTQLRLNERRQSEEARIVYDQELREKELSKERYLDEQQIARERAVELANLKRLREVDEQRIQTEKAVQTTALHREVELAAEKQKKEEAIIEQERETERLRIEKQRTLEQERIAGQVETEASKIKMERQLEEARINKDNLARLTTLAGEVEVVEEQKRKDLAELERTKVLELTKRADEILITEEEASITQARIALAKVLTEHEGAQQDTLAVKIKAQAERQKEAAAIRAEEQAVLARIEKETALDLSVQEIRQLAHAKLDAAGHEAKAVETLSEAKRADALVQAEAERTMVEARNLTADHILKDARQAQLIGELAKIAAELVKPAEKIDSMKVVHVDGWNNGPALPHIGEGDSDESLLSQRGSQNAISTIIGGILQVGAFRPVFKQLLGEDGIEELDQDRLARMLSGLVPGLIETAGREVVKTSVRNEQERIKESKGQDDESGKK
jgi:uncharacterized membrane protein YqiK